MIVHTVEDILLWGIESRLKLLSIEWLNIFFGLRHWVTFFWRGGYTFGFAHELLYFHSGGKPLSNSRRWLQGNWRAALEDCPQ